MEHIFSNLETFTPTAKKTHSIGAIKDLDGNEIYYKLAKDDEELDPVLYNFRFILNDDGSLWEDGNRYLLWKAVEHGLNPKTLRAHSSALEEFKSFCNKNMIDYRVAKRITNRPNWIYPAYLKKRVDNRELASTTAKERIRPVTSFYGWLIDVEGVEFSVNLFKVSKAYIHGSNRYGLGFMKEVDVVDVNQIPNAQNENENDGFIHDEGKLRPLLNEQQEALEEALVKSSNTEMKLAFAFSLTTGARLQSIFTLRLKHFVTSGSLPKNYSDSEIDKWLKEQEHVDPRKKYELLIGPGTGIDSKSDKSYRLMVPGWLIQGIRIYIISERARRRRNGMLSQNHDLDQYIFITQRKLPFYMAKDDINISVYGKNPPEGGAVNTFISNTLKPQLRDMGHNFSFKFHDMRATFAMNFIESYWPLVEKGVKSEKWLLDQLRKLMGHSDIETTKKYLHFRDIEDVLTEIREAREERFIRLVA